MNASFFKFFCFWFLLISSTIRVNGNNIDSLKKEVESTDQERKASSLIQLVKLYSATDTSLKAKYLDEFHSINLEELKDSSYRNIVQNYALYLKEAYQYEEAIHFLKRALLFANRTQDTVSLALFHELLSSNYFYLFQYDSCEYQVNLAINYYEYLKNIGQLGLMTVRKSGVFYAQGDYEKAIEYAFEATELFKQAKDEKQLAIAYLQLGNIFYFLSNYEKAEQYYELSSSAFLNADNEHGYYEALSNIGLIKITVKEYKESLPIQLEALQYFEKNNNKLEAGNAYRYLSAGYFGINNYDSARYYNELAMNFDLKTGYKVGLTQGYLMNSKLSTKRGDLNNAIKWAKLGYNIADSIQHFESKKLLSHELAELYEKAGNINLSHQYLKEHLSILDSLDLDPNKLKDYAIRHQFKVEEAQFKLLLSEEKEKFQEKLNKKIESQLFVAIIVATVSIVLLILVSFFLIRNKKLAKELNEQKNRIREELLIKESLLSEIHHRVKNNLQVVSSMLSLQSQYINNDGLEKIIDDCRGRINSMSLIHESLYKKVDNNQALFGTYIKNLIPRLIETYQIDENKIKLNMDVEEIQLSLDESVPCGLIINEIVSNALKHAFPDGQNGEINITLKKINDKVMLKIADNGVGLEKKIFFDQLESFGFLLIDTMAKQLEAELTVSSENGVAYLIQWVNK